MRHPFREGEEIFRTSIPSVLERRGAVIDEALRVLEEAGLDPDPFFDRLILDEALENAIVHGNREDPSKEVTLRLFAGRGRWGAEVADEGAGFDWEAALARTRGPAPTLLEGTSGRGLALICRTATQVLFLDGGRRRVMVREPGRVGRPGREGSTGGEGP